MQTQDTTRKTRRPRGIRIEKPCQHCGILMRVAPHTLAEGKGKFCSPACKNAAQRTDEVERFWSKVTKTDTCWLWTGGATYGYGYFWLASAGQNVRAHRYSYQLVHGSIADDIVVRHVCPGEPRRACVRPDHLAEGTQDENIQDKVRVGRQAHGAQHGRARLTAEQVLQMRRLYREGASAPALREQFGLSDSATRSILAGRTWRHLL